MELAKSCFSCGLSWLQVLHSAFFQLYALLFGLFPIEKPRLMLLFDDLRSHVLYCRGQVLQSGCMDMWAVESGLKAKPHMHACRPGDPACGVLLKEQPRGMIRRSWSCVAACCRFVRFSRCVDQKAPIGNLHTKPTD